MASRSDQLHSHQFTRQRVVGALALHDANPAAPPLRRITGALVAAVMVVVLSLAAVAVFGLLRPGTNTSWRSADALVIEQETGAQFVYLDGILHPVLNFSSALLVLGSPSPPRALTSRAMLAGIPRGPAVGIPGAPDLLPAANQLLTGSWTLCSRRAGAGDTAAPRMESLLLVGSGPTTPVEPLATRGLLARDPTGDLHLIWRDRRFHLRDPVVVLAAFAWPRQAAVPVAAAVLNAIPTGSDLGRLAVGSAGGPSRLAGYRVGQVVVVQTQSGGRQYAVVQADGLADITQVQADLLLAGGANQDAGPLPISQADYAGAPKSVPLVPTDETAPPAATPELVRGAESVCVSYADNGTAGVGLAATAPRAVGEIAAGAAAAAAATAVVGTATDWIAVPPGRGAVVEALPRPGATSGSLAVVSDLGAAFPVPSADVLAILGYGAVRPQRLPSALMALLPYGRALDPAAAAAMVGMA